MEEMSIKRAPKGLMILLLVGPSFVWAVEYIGSGELIIATRTGAVLGTSNFWAAAIGLFIVMPKMLSKESYAVLRPSRIFGVGLLVTFFVFGYIMQRDDQLP